MTSKIPVTIVYTPGTYGSYFHWALRTVAGFNTVDNPLSFEGNSHNHQNTWVSSGNFRDRVASNSASAQEIWNQIYNEFDRTKVTVSAHPSLKSENNSTFKDILDRIANDSIQVILINPDVTLAAFMLNNIASKIHQGGESEWLNLYIDNPETKKIVTSNWNLDHNIKVDNIPRWVLREFLSLQLYPSWLELIGNNCLDFDNLPNNVTVIDVHKILYSISEVLEQVTGISSQLKFDPVLLKEKVLPVHKQMLEKQRYVNEDQHLDYIVSTTLLDINETHWNPLSLVSEALVQHKLREHGYEVKCNGLDTFPTSSVQLRQLIYKDPA